MCHPVKDQKGEKVSLWKKKLLGHGIQWQEIIYSPKVDTYGQTPRGKAISNGFVWKLDNISSCTYMIPTYGNELLGSLHIYNPDPTDYCHATHRRDLQCEELRM